MTKILPCQVCGKPVTISTKYSRALKATCSSCGETGATPFGEKFAQVFKAGWYADHVRNVSMNNKLNTVLLVALIATQVPGLVDRLTPTYASQEEARRACWKEWVAEGGTYTVTAESGYIMTNPRTERIRSCVLSKESRQWLAYEAKNRTDGQVVNEDRPETRNDRNRGVEFVGKTYRF